MSKIRVLAVVMIAAIVLMFAGHIVLLRELSSQQRQIEQLCRMFPDALTNGEPDMERCQFAHLPPGEYTLYFADYIHNKAIMLRQPNGQKGDHRVLVYDIPVNTLQSWDWMETRRMPPK